MKPKVLPESLFDGTSKLYDIGCGSRPYPGAIGVDLVALPGVQIVADLNGKWPFEDESVDGLIATHVLEHLNLLSVMEEAHRVLKPGGYFWIRVPHVSFRDFWRDPTHIRPFMIRTFDFWMNGHETDYGFRAKYEILHRALHLYGYLEVHKFRKSVSWFADPIRRFIDFLANANPRFCERFWSFMVGGFTEAEFVLRKPVSSASKSGIA